MWRACATRSTWYAAAAGEISGSSPLPDDVTRSTGMGCETSVPAALRAAMRPLSSSASAGLVGPRFEAPEPVGLYGIGEVAERRPQKYWGASNCWPMSALPTTLPSTSTRLPLAWRWNAAWPNAVITAGYTRPVMTVSTAKITIRGRNCDFILASYVSIGD